MRQFLFKRTKPPSLIALAAPLVHAAVPSSSAADTDASQLKLEHTTWGLSGRGGQSFIAKLIWGED